MRLFYFKTGYVSANTYIVYNENNMRGFVIDPGGNYKRIKKEAEDRGITLEAQLLTHGHFDHCGASHSLQQDGIKVYIHKDDAEKLHGGGNGADIFRLPFESFTADYILNDGDVINIADIEIKVMHTPGHTSGGVCYIIGDNIFTGDTLFYLSVGRTDLPDGDAARLQQSLKKIFALEGDYNVYPGHNGETTLVFERKNNYFAQWI
jgi:hydroxyacylglutathione hydrolase